MESKKDSSSYNLGPEVRRHRQRRGPYLPKALMQSSGELLRGGLGMLVSGAPLLVLPQKMHFEGSL